MHVHMYIILRMYINHTTYLYIYIYLHTHTQAIVCGAKPTIEDDTNSLEATLLDELVANLSNVASVYHKRPAAFVDGKKLAPEVSLVYLLYWYKRTHTHTFFFLRATPTGTRRRRSRKSSTQVC